jgi:chromosome segregation ATPase
MLRRLSSNSSRNGMVSLLHPKLAILNATCILSRAATLLPIRYASALLCYPASSSTSGRITEVLHQLMRSTYGHVGMQDERKRTNAVISAMKHELETSQHETQSANESTDAARITANSLQSDVQRLHTEVDATAAKLAEMQLLCHAAETAAESSSKRAAESHAEAAAMKLRHAGAAADVGAVVGELTDARDAAVAEAQVTKLIHV